MRLPVYQLATLSADQLPFLNSILSRLTHAVNTVEFGSVVSSGGENVLCSLIVTPGDNDADKAVSASHTLGRKPMGTLAIWQDTAAVLYKPTAAVSADTSDQVFYIFDTASTSAVLLLI